MNKSRTTADLRNLLWETIDGVRAGEVTPTAAKAVALGVEKIIETAELETRYAELLSRLDKDDQGVNPGPMLLTQGDT